ncbi:hypothetical protein EDB92DRAFT_1816290 [Lactarius akahatsu]|uniref:CHAT domain-containing protein n=1 Tax=Lactarius akahatsu TaxID=416441 RepID=A0AAD4LFA6_9AGAM|nr:hypothetical protein EDB92DRAFT_1816290 [Lactarius akahatsu]
MSGTLYHLGLILVAFSLFLIWLQCDSKWMMRNHVGLDGLRDHQIAHFVCHGTLEAQKSFDAGFELHGNERLTPLNIVRSHLPAAEFAFLSAYHTAELTDGSSADEGLHLPAAMQYCGFRSVVGTMWAMANEDGPELAKHFYNSMFPKEGQGELVPYYKRSAGALRHAVKKLRKKRGITLERWCVQRIGVVVLRPYLNLGEF